MEEGFVRLLGICLTLSPLYITNKMELFSYMQLECHMNSEAFEKGCYHNNFSTLRINFLKYLSFNAQNKMRNCHYVCVPW